MAKVTYSSAKGLVVESGTGFQVNDAPVLEEIQALAEGEADTVNINNFGITTMDAGAGDETCTLPDGDAAGQLKTVILSSTTGGDLIVNNAAAAGIATLDTAGDYVHCLWTGSAWVIVASEAA